MPSSEDLSPYLVCGFSGRKATRKERLLCWVGQDGMGWDIPNKSGVVSLDVKQHGKKACCIGWDRMGQP